MLSIIILLHCILLMSNEVNDQTTV